MKVIGIVGWSGAGKTTLIAKLVPLLVARGLRISTVKHAHHSFDVDKPGKDSYVHRMAGATEVLVASTNRWALMHELRGAPAPELAVLLRHLAPVDLVIVEGFKTAAHAKIEVHRVANGKPPLYPDDPSVRGVVSDLDAILGLPHAALDDIEAAAELVITLGLPMQDTLRRLDAAPV